MYHHWQLRYDLSYVDKTIRFFHCWYEQKSTDFFSEEDLIYLFEQKTVESLDLIQYTMREYYFL